MQRNNFWFVQASDFKTYSKRLDFFLDEIILDKKLLPKIRDLLCVTDSILEWSDVAGDMPICVRLSWDRNINEDKFQIKEELFDLEFYTH